MVLGINISNICYFHTIIKNIQKLILSHLFLNSAIQSENQLIYSILHANIKLMCFYLLPKITNGTEQSFLFFVETNVCAIDKILYLNN